MPKNTKHNVSIALGGGVLKSRAGDGGAFPIWGNAFDCSLTDPDTVIELFRSVGETFTANRSKLKKTTLSTDDRAHLDSAADDALNHLQAVASCARDDDEALTRSLERALNSMQMFNDETRGLLDGVDR